MQFPARRERELRCPPRAATAGRCFTWHKRKALRRTRQKAAPVNAWQLGRYQPDQADIDPVGPVIAGNPDCGFDVKADEVLRSSGQRGFEQKRAGGAQRKRAGPGSVGIERDADHLVLAEGSFGGVASDTQQLGTGLQGGRSTAVASAPAGPA